MTKKTKLVAVQVADCGGASTVTKLIAGINWAVANSHGIKGNVILVGSSTREVSTALNNAVSDAFSKGVVVLVPAGGHGTDACAEFPASAPSALTVAATTPDDHMLAGSNFGKCVDVLAPGKDILSAWTGPAGRTATRSGTAMAAAHAAGIAATFRSTESLTHAQVGPRIKSAATKNTVKGLTSATPSALLYNDAPR
ncbi:S8 family serine peptidase [Streptomyces sp. NPDC048258]|uniref:S8 family serine peptidase n=1 Tax=Streptomyces sp. NPDC048258 TaxID=3365527 RepID=UPI0037125F4E